MNSIRKEDSIKRLLEFLFWLYNHTKEPYAFNFGLEAKLRKSPYPGCVGVILKNMKILAIDRSAHSGGRSIYTWKHSTAPNYYLATHILKECNIYDNNKKKKKKEPNHIAVNNKYLIPFSANDLRYVDTIEEGIELISSAIVAVGDYNIYKLVTKIEKVSNIKITNI